MRSRRPLTVAGAIIMEPACLLLSLEFPANLTPVSEDYGMWVDAVKAVRHKFAVLFLFSWSARPGTLFLVAQKPPPCDKLPPPFLQPARSYRAAHTPNFWRDGSWPRLFCAFWQALCC